MIELGFASDFGGQSTKLSEIREGLRRISEAGFTHVHWCHEWDGDYLYAPSEMLQIKSWFDTFGLKAKSLHASKGGRIASAMRKDMEARKDFASFHEYSRQAGVELIRNRMELAEVLGAREIVIHLYVPYLTFREQPGSEEQFYRQVFKSFDELKPEAMERGIRICLETMLEIPAREQYRQFDRIFARYPKEYIGICWDTGHTHVILNEDMTTFAKRYRDRIFSVHLNDNLGGPRIDLDGKEELVWCCDMHWIPWEGTIDWEAVTDVLAESPYELPIVLELNCHEKNQKEFLRRSYEAGIRLANEMERKRI